MSFLKDFSKLTKDFEGLTTAFGGDKKKDAPAQQAAQHGKIKTSKRSFTGYGIYAVLFKLIKETSSRDYY
jgi:hypothetical protein